MKPLDWYRKRVFWLGLTLCFSGALSAISFEILGPTYAIQEQDLLAVIEEKLKTLEINGKLGEIEQEMENRLKSYVQRPTPVRGLRKTLKSRKFHYDPTVVVHEDLSDHTGKVFHHKGDKVNPLETLHLERPLVFIDGEDSQQLEWVLQWEKNNEQAVTLIFVNGPVFEWMKRLKRSLYFDQGGTLIRKFGIQQVPAIVTQDNQYLLVEERVID